MVELHKYHDTLFSTLTTREVLNNLMKQVDKEINNLSSIELSTNPQDELVEKIVSKLLLSPIKLTKDRIISKPTISGDTKTWEIIQTFSGSKILLLLKNLEGPLEYPRAIPTGKDGDNTIRWRYNLEVNASLDYANEYNLKTLQAIEAKLVYANRASNEINRELHEYTIRRVDQRINSFNRDNELINRLNQKG